MIIIDLDEISFAEWLVELNEVAVSKGFLTTEGFVAETGQMEWLASFEAGLSPEEALYIAALDGLEYGSLYGH
jgi:hypothetical protein